MKLVRIALFLITYYKNHTINCFCGKRTRQRNFFILIFQFLLFFIILVLPMTPNRSVSRRSETSTHSVDDAGDAFADMEMTS